VSRLEIVVTFVDVYFRLSCLTERQGPYRFHRISTIFHKHIARCPAIWPIVGCASAQQCYAPLNSCPGVFPLSSLRSERAPYRFNNFKASTSPLEAAKCIDVQLRQL
jgi:hypothetical protein